MASKKTDLTYCFQDHCVMAALKRAIRIRDKELLPPLGIVLDLGCGACDSTKLLLDLGAERVVGVDLDKALIEDVIASGEFKNTNVEFRTCDIRDESIDDLVGKVDLLLAVWVHNFLHDSETQRSIARRIEELLSPRGMVVFCIPSSSYKSITHAKMGAQAKWWTVWTEHTSRYSRNTFTFEGAKGWQNMTCWEPLQVCKFYSDFLDMGFVDTKGRKLAGFMDINDLEPHFDVVWGIKKEEVPIELEEGETETYVGETPSPCERAMSAPLRSKLAEAARTPPHLPTDTK